PHPAVAVRLCHADPVRRGERMTRPFEHQAELEALIDALCEGSITAEQVQRLEQLVLAHPEAEAYYVQAMSLHADLALHLRALPGLTGAGRGGRVGTVTPAALPVPQRRRWPAGRGRLLGWGGMGLSGLAAGLLLAVAFQPGPQSASTERDKDPERVDNTVAVLLHAPEAGWGETELPPRARAPPPPRALRLQSGVAPHLFYHRRT